MDGGPEPAGAPLPDDSVLWSIPVSIARVDVESVADVFDPKNKAKQEQLCDHVALWSQNLSQSLSELLAWKDDCFELKALPLNMLSQLAIITSRLIREKGEMIPPLHQALGLTRSFITGKVVDQEVEALKAAIIQQSNELEMETMRRIESERKLSAALQRIQQLEADQKMHRWQNMYTQLKMRASQRQSQKLAEKLRSHNKLLGAMADNARAKASAASGGSEVAFGASTGIPGEQAMLSMMAAGWAEDMADSPRMPVSAPSMQTDLWGRDQYTGTPAMSASATTADLFQAAQVAGDQADNLGPMLTTQELSAVLEPEPEPEPGQAAVPAPQPEPEPEPELEPEPARAGSAPSAPKVSGTPPAAATTARPLTGTSTNSLPLFPVDPAASAKESKDSYSRDEFVDAKLLHAKQLHFVSEMYQKRIGNAPLVFSGMYVLRSHEGDPQIGWSAACNSSAASTSGCAAPSARATAGGRGESGDHLQGMW